MTKRPETNIAMLLVFLAVVLSPFLVAYLNGQAFTLFDLLTMGMLVLFAFAVFIWWKKRKKTNPNLLDDPRDLSENTGGSSR